MSLYHGVQDELRRLSDMIADDVESIGAPADFLRIRALARKVQLVAGPRDMIDAEYAAELAVAIAAQALKLAGTIERFRSVADQLDLFSPEASEARTMRAIAERDRKFERAPATTWTDVLGYERSDRDKAKHVNELVAEGDRLAASLRIQPDVDEHTNALASVYRTLRADLIPHEVLGPRWGIPKPTGDGS